MGVHALLQAVLGAYGIHAAIDPGVNDQAVSFNVTQLSFSDALKLVQLATGTFAVPVDQHHVLVLADTSKNREQYQRQIMETVAFPGLSKAALSEMESIANNVAGVKQAVISPSQGSITLRGSESNLNALNKVYRELEGGQSEVRLDIHVYEVDRSKDRDAGVILPNSATLFNVQSEADSVLASNASLVQEIIASGAATAGNWEEIIAILIASGDVSGTEFNNPFVVFGGGITETGAEWNTTAANMLLNSSDVRSINQVQLSVLDHEQATFLDGERYPVITGELSNLTGVSDSSTATAPQFQYENLGLTLKLTPDVEANREVMLHLKLQLAALAGSTLNDIPILSNRQFEEVVSIHSGESALIVSAMSRQDSRLLTGIPGLGNATNREGSTSSQELVVLVTPFIIRLRHAQAAGPIIPLGAR